MLNNFVAIDFETANSSRSSVCSVGIVVVENRIVTNQFYSLIRPTPDYYSRINTSIHHLTQADTCDAPRFPEVWQQIVPLVHDYPFVAHNSAFDRSCLKASFNAYALEYPDYEFYCTVIASRQVFRDLPDHKLGTVAKHIGYDLDRHHHALADAMACAQIALRVL